MVRVVHISQVDTQELFKTRGFLLGDNKGDWFVEDGNIYLGRYVDKERAQEHADSLVETAFDYINPMNYPYAIE